MLMISAPIPTNDSLRLAALRRYDILDTPLEQSYDDMTRLAAFICEAPYSTITLVDADRQWFKSEVGFGARETNRRDGFCAHTILEPMTMVVEDALMDPRFSENPFVLGGPKIRFYAGAPLVTPDGFVLGTLCVFDDKPRQLKAEQLSALEALARQVMIQFELRLQMIEKMRTADTLRTTEKLAAVGRLASSIAHEINNPLQAVTNLLFLADTLSTTPQQKSCVRDAQDELRRVSQIVIQTLRFHRQSEKAMPVQLGEIFASILVIYRTRLTQAQVEIRIEDRQKVPILLCASEIRQVMVNLISNSLDAMRSHGGTILVRLRDAVHPLTGSRGIRLTLADEGAGMSRETMARMYEPFFTTNEETGTGLGMWVSKGILDKHGATIRVRSCCEPGRCGSVFSIFVPHADETNAAAGCVDG